MGRKPKPVEHLKEIGTFRPGKHGAREAAAEGFLRDKPIPPPEIMQRPDALEFYNRLIESVPIQILATSDWGDVHMVCIAWADFMQLDRDMKDMSILDEPYIELMRLKITAMKSYTSLSAKFGMNPLDRGRLKVEKPKSSSTNPVQALLDKRKQG